MRFVLCIVWGMLAGVATAAAQNPSEPIATRQNAFAIPFRIDAPANPAEAPVEVRLFSSQDAGASWRVEASADPRHTSFSYRAPHDGEYWFVIRTVDRSGRLRPDKPPAPELRVVVDTIPPRLDITADRTPTGEIVASWQMVDPNLNPESLRIEYQAAGDTAWREVALPGGGASRAARVGSTTWRPTELRGSFAVRAQVADKAGNLARSSSQIEDPSAAPVTPDVAARGTPILNPAGAGAWPAHSAEAPLNGATAGRPAAAAPTGPASMTASGYPPRSEAAAGQRLPINPALASQYPERRSEPTLATGGPLMPAGERPQMVNSKNFDMDYEVDSVGPSGIGKVELWGTQDGGRTWNSFGVDGDNRSPMRATVLSEGLYGFRISVQSGSGLGGVPPQSGDMPEVWVNVDLTPPQLQLLSAEQGVAERAGELVIRWQAEDASLAARPVSISFSNAAGGPWYTIAAGLENSGVYGWWPDNRVPDQIWLRLEARDDAGNTASYESQSPTLLDRLRPEGRIRGIRSAGS